MAAIDYIIEPPFDSALNARLNAGIEPSARRDKTVGEIVEAAVRHEREACAHILSYIEVFDGEDKEYAREVVSRGQSMIRSRGAENEQQSVQAGEAEEAQALGSE